MKNNAENELNIKVRNPDFLCLSGSRLYGTNTPESDIDLRGFVVPPYEYIIGLKSFNCAELDGDHKVYNLRDFLSHVLAGDPQTTELLFAPESVYQVCNDVGKKILSLRSEIVSLNIYNRILGYSNSEWRRANGERMIIEPRTPTEDEVVNNIRNTFEPDKQTMDAVLDLLLQNKKRTIIKSTRGVGEKRMGQFEKYGYCTSSAAHCIRLSTQLCHLLEYGEMIFPLPNANFVRDIKLGKFKYDEITKLYEENIQRAKELRETTKLREKPNTKLVWDVYEDIVVNSLLNDGRLKERFSSIKL